MKETWENFWRRYRQTLRRLEGEIPGFWKELLYAVRFRDSHYLGRPGEAHDVRCGNTGRSPRKSGGHESGYTSGSYQTNCYHANIPDWQGGSRPDGPCHHRGIQPGGVAGKASDRKSWEASSYPSHGNCEFMGYRYSQCFESRDRLLRMWPAGSYPATLWEMSGGLEAYRILSTRVRALEGGTHPNSSYQKLCYRLLKDFLFYFIFIKTSISQFSFIPFGLFLSERFSDLWATVDLFSHVMWRSSFSGWLSDRSSVSFPFF